MLGEKNTTIGQFIKLTKKLPDSTPIKEGSPNASSNISLFFEENNIGVLLVFNKKDTATLGSLRNLVKMNNVNDNAILYVWDSDDVTECSIENIIIDNNVIYLD